MKLENVVVYNLEVVNQLDAQVAASLDVILYINKPIDFYLDSKAVWGELSRDLFIDFNKHIMRALHDALLALFLAYAVSKS